MNGLLISVALLAISLIPLQAEDMNVTLSPDGRTEAFTRDNDLWVRSVADSAETRLTFDGSAAILNGYASWLYYEEILGRPSKYKAFWWSPDSRKIAFYRFDNAAVPVFPIYSPFGQDGSLNLTRYPKAGETNPTVRVGVADLVAGSTVWASFEDSPDQYFGTPFWGADSGDLYVSRQPRRQDELDLYAVKALDGSLRHIYHEEYPTWVDWIEGMIFTDKGLYMARNFETGWEQIYFLSYDGTVRRLTEGRNWDISLLKADPRKGDLWFTAKRDSRLHTTLYRLDSRGRVTALSDPDYSVRGVKISDDFKSFEAVQSNARTPWKGIKGRTDRYSARVVVDTSTVDITALPSPKPVKIENDGFDLYALVSLPAGFDSTRRYPVLMQLYGGPGTPYVRDTWADRDASDLWCFEHGVIYIVADPRSSGENGRRGMDEAFRRMTVIELQDYIAWAKWLQSLPYIDGSRIGVEGFSFGGTTTAMLVLRYPQYFCCGVAGGGVYDWRLYDSYYTEKFMDTPAANPDGYAEASVLTYIPEVFADGGSAPALTTKPASVSTTASVSMQASASTAAPIYKPAPGALKLTHGTGDDNVHFQNTLQIVDALQKASYRFELMIYPDGKHGYHGYQHIHDQMDDHSFWTFHLLADIL